MYAGAFEWLSLTLHSEYVQWCPLEKKNPVIGLQVAFSDQY